MFNKFKIFAVPIVFALVIFSIGGCSISPVSRDFNRAEEYFSAGRFDSAIIVFSSIVEKYPDSNEAAKSQYKIAHIHKDFLYDDQKALSSYLMYLSIYPNGEDAVKARHDIAELYSKIGEYWKAIKEYQHLSAVDKSGKRYLYLYKIAMEYLKVNELRQARIEFREIAEKSVDAELIEKSSFQIANTYYLEGSNDKAMKAFDEFLEKYPNGPLYLDAALDKASILSEEGKLEVAVKWLRDLKEDYPNDVSIDIRLASINDRIENGPKMKLPRKWVKRKSAKKKKKTVKKKVEPIVSKSTAKEVIKEPVKTTTSVVEKKVEKAIIEPVKVISEKADTTKVSGTRLKP